MRAQQSTDWNGSSGISQFSAKQPFIFLISPPPLLLIRFLFFESSETLSFYADSQMFPILMPSSCFLIIHNHRVALHSHHCQGMSAALSPQTLTQIMLLFPQSSPLACQHQLFRGTSQCPYAVSTLCQAGKHGA